MELLLTPEILSAIVALVQLYVNKAARKSGLPTIAIVIITTVLVGAGYTAYEMYAPGTLQEAVVSFTTRTFAIQWLLYEVWKKRKGAPRPQ